MTAGLASDFTLYKPGFFESDPTEYYARLRAEEPVAWSEAYGGYWVVSRYEDVHHVMTHPELFSNRQNTIPAFSHPAGKQIPVELDPPEHTWYRRILAPIFAPREVNRIKDSVETAAAAAVDALAERGKGDFVSEIGEVIPIRAFLEFLGAPVSDTPQLMGWKDDILKGGLSGTEEGIKRKQQAQGEVAEYFTRLLTEREGMADAPNDVLTCVVRGTLPDGRLLRMDEKLRMCSLLMTAGLDTTTAVLSLCVEFLARHPEHLAQLRETEELSVAAEELSRIGSIVSTGRLCTQDTELGGTQIKEGDFVMVLTASAAKDGAQFPDPEVVDLTRTPNRHLCYGAGPHRCVGSHLARLQVVAVLKAMRRYDFTLDPDKVVKRHVGYLMGVDELPLVLTRI